MVLIFWSDFKCLDVGNQIFAKLLKSFTSANKKKLFAKTFNSDNFINC